MALNFLRKIALVSSILLPTAVLAHGDAQWIAEGGFKIWHGNADCCGEHDCEVMPPDVLKNHVRDNGQTIDMLIDGKVVFTFTKGIKLGAHKSKDEQWWWCRNPTAKRLDQIKTPYCVFYPIGIM